MKNRRRGNDVKQGADRAGEIGRGRTQRVAVAGIIQGQRAESGHAINRRHCHRVASAQLAVARIGGGRDHQRHHIGRSGCQIAVNIQHLHLHRWRHGRVLHRGARFRQRIEEQLCRRGRGDGERITDGAFIRIWQPGGIRGQGVGADDIHDQTVEGGDAVDGIHRPAADQDDAGGAIQRQRDRVTGVRVNVPILILDLYRDRRGNGRAGHRVARSLHEDQLRRRADGDIERRAGGAADGVNIIVMHRVDVGRRIGGHLVVVADLRHIQFVVAGHAVDGGRRHRGGGVDVVQFGGRGWAVEFLRQRQGDRLILHRGDDAAVDIFHCHLHRRGHVGAGAGTFRRFRDKSQLRRIGNQHKGIGARWPRARPGS